MRRAPPLPPLPPLLLLGEHRFAGGSTVYTMGSNAEASLDVSRRPDTVVVFGGPAASFLGRPRPRFTPVLLVGVQFPPGDRAVGEREARFGILICEGNVVARSFF